MQETLYDALLTAREVREEWERDDTLHTDRHPPIHTVYVIIANKDTVYVWVYMRHQYFRDRDSRELVYVDDVGEGIR